MADEKGTYQIMEAARRNPISAATLISVIAGGTFMYFSVRNDAIHVKEALDVAQSRGGQRNDQQDRSIAEVRSKIEKVEAETASKFDQLRRDVGDMKSDIREISTNMKWLSARERKDP